MLVVKVYTVMSMVACEVSMPRSPRDVDGPSKDPALLHTAYLPVAGCRGVDDLVELVSGALRYVDGYAGMLLDHMYEPGPDQTVTDV